jgi:hypothetical protein
MFCVRRSSTRLVHAGREVAFRRGPHACIEQGRHDAHAAGFPDGCVQNTEGWSNRLMFRTRKSQKNPKEAVLVSYRYYPGKSKDCGEEIPWKYSNGDPVKIEAGKPYRVTVYIKLNSGGETHRSTRAHS